MQQPICNEILPAKHICSPVRSVSPSRPAHSHLGERRLMPEQPFTTFTCRSGESSWNRAIFINVPPFYVFFSPSQTKLKFIEMWGDHAGVGRCTKHRMTIVLQ